MTYLLAFIILANGAQISLPITVHGSLQTCETAKVKTIQAIKRDYKDAQITSVCLDR
jgi:hypothetical protein